MIAPAVDGRAGDHVDVNSGGIEIVTKEVNAVAAFQRIVAGTALDLVIAALTVRGNPPLFHLPGDQDRQSPAVCHCRHART